MDEDLTKLDDPDLLAACESTRAAIEALTDKYRALADEFARRAAAQWSK